MGIYVLIGLWTVFTLAVLESAMRFVFIFKKENIDDRIVSAVSFALHVFSGWAVWQVIP